MGRGSTNVTRTPRRPRTAEAVVPASPAPTMMRSLCFSAGGGPEENRSFPRKFKSKIS